MRRVSLALLGALVLAAVPGSVLGLLLWTIDVSPSTAVVDESTIFTVSVSNLDLLTEIGCVEVLLPDSFVVQGASAGNASNGDEWEAVVFGNRVAAHSLSGGGRLELGQSVSFTITAIPNDPGDWQWSTHAHRQQDCTGPEELGPNLSIHVEPGEQPTATPTVAPTPKPTATPTPLISIPTLPPLPLPLPTASPTPRPPPSPTSSPSRSPTSSSAAAPVPAPSQDALLPAGGPTPAGSSGLVLAGGLQEDARAGAGAVSLGPFGVLDGIGVWAIPGAIVGGPGLLVILWVVIQTGVAVAWIPAVRRLRGKDTRRPVAPLGPQGSAAG